MGSRLPRSPLMRWYFIIVFIVLGSPPRQSVVSLRLIEAGPFPEGSDSAINQQLGPVAIDDAIIRDEG